MVSKRPFVKIIIPPDTVNALSNIANLIHSARPIAATNPKNPTNPMNPANPYRTHLKISHGRTDSLSSPLTKEKRA